AMSFGLMPLVSLVSGVSDIVADNDSGLLFEAGNLDAFAARLETAVAMSHEERSEFGLRARAEVERRFGIDLVAERHVALYRRLKLDR
ncbi:MAG: glycosyltransferase, partial [Steroidobacteraceae bacterium]